MSVAADETCQAGIRKAAILVASLDPATAERLLGRLGPDCAELVRQAAVGVDRLGSQERQRVIDEFRHSDPMVPQRHSPGIELNEPLVGPPSTSFHPDSPPHCNGGAFGFLLEAEEERLRQLLVGERPPTIALVLSHLPPERAAGVLARFAPPLQVEIVRRLADSQNTDPESLREVEQVLEARLSRQSAPQPGRTAGPETAAKILAACDGRVAKNILENLAACDEPLAERLGRRPLEFHQLAELDDATLWTVFRAVEPEVVQAALLGAPPDLVERVLHCMDPEGAKRLRHKLDHPDPIRLGDVEDARRQIAALTQRVLHSGPQIAAMAA